MGHSHSTVQVGVRNRTLWVGGEAYPLHNIARVHAREWTPDRGAAVREFAKNVAKPIAAGMFALVLLACLGGDAVPGTVYVGLFLLVGGIVTVRAVQLIRYVSQQNRYALVVETAGSPHAALVSTDRNVVLGLVGQVVEAIDNPAKEFSLHVEQVYGDKFDGDKFDGSKFDGDHIGGNKISY
ncbi:DUF6232 family protein [Solwaraspora sp. WMMB335]|uniref:DUF6232 family protein n=1 Tax=Solwaraspora sp. WMMB335 TaxID=3404118 RepID=UPI003B94E83A